MIIWSFLLSMEIILGVQSLQHLFTLPPTIYIIKPLGDKLVPIYVIGYQNKDYSYKLQYYGR
jgi:hypothetical protein